MLEKMWESWNANSLLVKLWADPTILESSLELCPKGYKNVHTLWPNNITSRTVSQRDHKNGKDSHMYKNIYSSSLWGGQKLEIKGMSINWGMAEQIVVYECNGILLCYEKWWTGRLQRGLERLIWTDAEWKEQNQENIVHSNNHSVQGIYLVDLVLHCKART